MTWELHGDLQTPVEEMQAHIVECSSFSCLEKLKKEGTMLLRDLIEASQMVSSQMRRSVLNRTRGWFAQQDGGGDGMWRRQ